MKHLKSSLLIILILAASYTTTAQDKNIVSISSVKTESGIISGIAGTDASVKVFRGVPFAAPPLGELRWKEPQQVKPWEGIKKCESFGPSAMQGAPIPFGVYTSDFLIPSEPISEDCLYLNIWTTASQANEKLPVIVFIHGGAFVAGSGSVPIYDGESMAKKGIVFVTINYRLGLFGFFAHPDLTKESAHNASGNYGIMDQVQALKWIKNNIKNFGGDPDNVTIAGQSAGSMSVNILSASPLARGLFHKIIAESGAFVLPNLERKSVSLEQAEKEGIEIAKTLNANTLTDLRNLPAEELMKVSKGMPAIIADGFVLPESIPEIFAKGMQANFPLLTGWNGDDVLWSAPATVQGYKAEIEKQYGKDADLILKYYPASTDEEATASNAALGRDLYFGIQNYSWARKQSEASKAYLYYFTRKVPAVGESVKYGAFHSGEITYAYNNLRFQPYRPFEEADNNLARLMSSYWSNFAKTGDPNSDGLPEWHAFDKSKGEVMILDVDTRATQHPYYEVLEYFYKLKSEW